MQSAPEAPRHRAASPADVSPRYELAVRYFEAIRRAREAAADFAAIYAEDEFLWTLGLTREEFDAAAAGRGPRPDDDELEEAVSAVEVMADLAEMEVARRVADASRPHTKWQ